MSDKVKRCFLHIPVGLLTVMAAYISLALPIVVVFSFIAYEVTEDWRIKDKGYIDIFGYLCGLAIGIVTWFTWRLI